MLPFASLLAFVSVRPSFTHIRASAALKSRQTAGMGSCVAKVQVDTRDTINLMNSCCVVSSALECWLHVNHKDYATHERVKGRMG